MSVKCLFPLAALACFSPACAATEHAAPSDTPAALGGGSRVGIDPSIIDRTVDPCVDFYAYACGGWIRTTQIPRDEPRWVRSFDVIRDANRTRLHELLEKAASGAIDPLDRYGSKVADFYSACMDEVGTERTGLSALEEELGQLRAVVDERTLAEAVGRLHAEGVFPLFLFRSTQDARDSSQVIGEIFQGGLTLPDRDDYLLKDERSAEVRRDFVLLMQKLLGLVGFSDAKAKAQSILSVETALAEAAFTRSELRDPNRIYHRLALDGLRRAAPHFDWDAYLSALGASAVGAFNVSAPPALARLDELVRATPASSWRAYLGWHLLLEAARLRALPRALSDEVFFFSARHFTGEKALPERWKHCVGLTDGLFGEALGQAFVRRYFAGNAKSDALALVTSIEAAFGRRIRALDWMDEATRTSALKKLQAVHPEVGYPAKWRTYDEVVVRREAFLASARSAAANEVRRQIAEIGKPVDREEWHMSSPTVNAYYDSFMNEIVFPAGILQPPLYTPGAPDAVNYGAIGLIMGHELTHGFDDEGRHYDDRGDLVDWWSAEVSAEFERRAACVEKQFSEYSAVEDVKLNGKLTLGENLADLGGLTLAFAAYRASREGRAPEAQRAGYGPEQQFFLAHAQAWCAVVRPENARLRARTDPHAPPRWRVDGPLSNFPEFARAFRCKEGDPMVRAERCQVW